MHAKKLRIMKGIRTDIKTKWKNYVIKEDAEKARYHKVIRGKDNLIETIRATGLKKGAAYTFSARVRLRIQETTCRKVLELTCLDTWHTIGEEMAIAGKGDMDVFLTSAFTPPDFADESSVWNIGVSCMRPEHHYVPHDGDYFILEHVMVNEGKKPLPYIDPE